MRKRNREINVFSMSALDLFASALGAFILMSLIFMVFFSMTEREENMIAEEIFAQCETERTQAGQDLMVARRSLAQCRAEVADSVDAGLLARCESQQAAAARQLAQCRASVAGTVDAATLARCEANLTAVQDNAAILQAQLAAADGLRQQLEQAGEALQNCNEMARQRFLLVIMSWSTTDDVDLHVVDPAGREFFFRQRNHRGSIAVLEEDNIRGPGNEIWLHPAAEPGRYQVCYKLYTRRGLSGSEVRGSVLWQEGSLPVPRVELGREDEVRLAVQILVDTNGNVSVDRSRSGRLIGSNGCA